MPHVYVIVRCSCNHIKLFIIKLAVSRFPLVTSRHIWTMKTVRNSASCLCYCQPHLQQLHKSYTCILMRKQCLMFMLLLAASTAITQELYLDEKTVPHICVIVSRIYGSSFQYHMNRKSDATYTKTYLLMRKQCLVFMLMLAASEHPEKNPLKIKLQKDIVESYKPIVWTEPQPISLVRNVSHLSNNHLFLPHMFLCSLGLCTCGDLR